MYYDTLYTVEVCRVQSPFTHESSANSTKISCMATNNDWPIWDLMGLSLIKASRPSHFKILLVAPWFETKKYFKAHHPLMGKFDKTNINLKCSLLKKTYGEDLTCKGKWHKKEYEFLCQKGKIQI